MAVADLWAFGTLLIAALGLGTALLSVLSTPSVDRTEFAALAASAGLGAMGVLLGLLGLFGSLHAARFLIPLGAATTLMWIAKRSPGPTWPVLHRPSPGMALLIMMVAAALLGSIAPVTDIDSLDYPIPIAQHLVRDGEWRFWPDQALSAYPLSQELLEAAVLDAGARRLGLLSGVEVVLVTVLLWSLARRLAREDAASWLAPILLLGCPAAAFLASSAKEDMLVIAMTVAATLVLYLRPSLGAAAAAGLFAGFAAGAKYSGAVVPVAVIACVPFCCGRNRRLTSTIVAAAAAAASGGLWYFMNLLRFGNPVAPLLPGLGHPPLAASAIQGWVNGWGYGHGPLEAILTPIRLTYDLQAFGSRGNWINPLPLLGVFGAVADRRRQVALPLLFISLCIYSVWFFMGYQVARMLLPATALLSVPAADVLIRFWRRFRIVRYPIGLVVALSAGVVIAVGFIRAERYLIDPASFLERETMHYADIDWMNKHLDPSRHRVATWFKTCGYLEIPWMTLLPNYQAEIRPEETGDPQRLYAALKRQGFTHLFGRPDDFAGLDDAQILVHANPASRLGSTRFFREPSTEPTAIFAIK